jgi:hypothetical protein
MRNPVRRGAGTIALGALTFLTGAGSMPAAAAPPAGSPAAEHARIVEHWTPERRAAAIPRDLVIDEQGQGYMKHPDGRLIPYGRTVAEGSSAPTPRARPGSGSDTTPPSVGSLDPNNTTIGASYTFKATVSDGTNGSGVRSVTFRVGRAGGTQQSFTPVQGASNVWSVSLQGFTDGSWTWSVTARDNAGNTTTTTPLTPFTVNTSTGGGGGGSTSDGPVIANQNVLTLAGAPLGGVSTLSRAVGRIFFEMPTNAKRTRWAGYVCSGTVVNDENVAGRSIIQTAAHCVYDDANKAFARNVLFIPNQAGTSVAGTDRTCSNDPIGCWSTWFGVVDVNWTTRTFPNNKAWDYAYYVVRDTLAYQPGLTTVNQVLDAAVTPVGISFQLPQFGVSGNPVDYTHAIGYSYSDDPNLMYCAEDLTDLDAANWWLPACGLSGGSSGGPWMQPLFNNTSLGSLVSVNSWGYTTGPGMAGPKLFGTSAQSVFACAKSGNGPSAAGDGNAGRRFPAECP